MRAFVITIINNEKSVEAAERCISSGTKNGVNIEKFEAYTPDDKPFEILEQRRVLTEGLIEKWSRSENCAAAFLSHFSLWQKCLELNAPIIVFEHDAYIMDPIPASLIDGYGFKQMISIGRPSYGQWRPPQFLGTGPLTSKKYFPGAHAYIVKPAGARTVIEWAQTKGARPTDVFLNKESFPFLEEFHPWPVEARDYFTTIQKEEGCLAKHNYVKNKEQYEIISAGRSV